ncbi:MAG: MarR family winged helix-turn-helix transcriptional regulator [Eubacteriales bacterium]|nr:winged helix-turn-helix transcriptional regulator [Clostridiales bacterium]
MGNRKNKYGTKVLDRDKLIPPRKEGNAEPKMTPIRMINEVSRLFWEVAHEHYPNDMMQNSYRLILIQLAIREGRSQLEIAHATHLKPPTISVTLQKMEADGLVVRYVDRNDMRTTRVYLTEKGRDINRRVQSHIRAVDEIATSGLTEEEMESLYKILSKIRRNLIEAKSL